MIKGINRFSFIIALIFFFILSVLQQQCGFYRITRNGQGNLETARYSYF